MSKGLGSVWGKIELHVTSICVLELLAAEYLPETNISIFIYHSLMVTCSLDVLKKFSKRKQMRIKKGKSVTIKYIQCEGDKEAKDRDDKILGFGFVFVG